MPDSADGQAQLARLTDSELAFLATSAQALEAEYQAILDECRCSVISGTLISIRPTGNQQPRRQARSELSGFASRSGRLE